MSSDKSPQEMLIDQLFEIKINHLPRTEQQKNEIKITVDDALTKLNNWEKQIINFSFGFRDGYSYSIEEISKILKITTGHVQHLKETAMTKLERFLKEG